MSSAMQSLPGRAGPWARAVGQSVAHLAARGRRRVQGMFNLNDGQWGRKDEPGQGEVPNQPPPPAPEQGNGNGNGNDGSRQARPQPQRPQGPRGNNDGPPDLDELWRDFNRKLGNLFGGNKAGSAKRNRGFGHPPSAPEGPQLPEFKGGKAGIGLVLGIAALLWLGTGFFIVQEGEQAVITRFGKYHNTVGAGFNWRLPYPVERHETVRVTQIRSVDIGRDAVMKATGLRDAAMLTQDENIVEIKFAVQYRLNDARAYLFESRKPDDAVVLAAEAAVREVVGKMKMDSALAEERDQIAPRVRKLMQDVLDQYKLGIEIVAVNLQQGGVRPPEQVQAAFDDVLKAGQERERAKNEAQAYANDVVPRAVGTASRLAQESQAYKARIIAQAEGDAQRFHSVVTEYQKAPQVTRDRLYLETMQQIYTGAQKVLIDGKQGANLLYLPLDKLMQQTLQNSGNPANSGANTAAPTIENIANAPAPAAAPAGDARARDGGRSRDRDGR